MADTKIIDVHQNYQGVAKVIGALLDPRAADPVSPQNGQVWINTTDGRLRVRLSGVTHDIADLNDVTAGSITGALWDAQSVVVAVTDNTPVAQTLGEGTVLGRLAGGNVTAVTLANLLS